MNKKINSNAFTLIELLVWISIIGIILLGTSNINFNSSTNRQKLEIFNNHISAEIERVRNNALIWKWVWVSLTVPEEWKIDFSTNNSWTIITSYLSWTWIQDKNFNFTEWRTLSNIKCIELNWASEYILPSTETWTIIFEWWSYNLGPDCWTYNSKLEIETSYKWLNKTVNFDTVNWLIKK